eukprot:CAMPEP_0170539402 /NCGR_PEP_ID=MMETSP0209-20121228/103908_1 /TAXON_ID=665100 ORGANISM="Litonotus pictus, Strain P1" /NCGR_SAMPLE_ID=MMETSP0209 /ASSEMBLY_ACC=CAM_ASM_000301 /LENGTH=360 /DNA_ID=CAMNT_0010841321 /DNA_START=195 /DNA_END=1273 /DNA_ORIENTATION=+
MNPYQNPQYYSQESQIPEPVLQNNYNEYQSKGLQNQYPDMAHIQHQQGQSNTQNKNTFSNYLQVNKLNKVAINNLLQELEDYKRDLYTTPTEKENRTIYKNVGKVNQDISKVQEQEKTMMNNPGLSRSGNFNKTNHNFVKNLSKVDYKAGLLIDFFLKVIQLDTSLNSIKQELFNKDDFNVELLFDSFDLSSTEKISITDFQEVLYDLNVFPSVADLKLIYKRFDRDSDGKLNMQEFCDLFTPVETSPKSKKVLNRYLTKNEEKFQKKDLHSPRGKEKEQTETGALSSERGSVGPISNESKDLLIEVIKITIEVEKEVEKLKSGLNEEKEFSCIELFEIIKTVNNIEEGYGEINEEEFGG